MSGTLVQPQTGVAGAGGPLGGPLDLLGGDLRGKWRVILGVNLAVLAWLLVVPMGRPAVAVAANVLAPLLACWWCLPVMRRRF